MSKPPAHKRLAAARRVGAARALSKLGVTSRSLAAAWVREGRVTLNGRLIYDPETPVSLEQDQLSVDGAAVRAPEKRYVMLNKPRGLVTTRSDEQGRDTVYRCLGPEAEWLAPVGRLDKASEGLLLFSNDSAWAARLMDPAAHVAKTYHVQIDRALDEIELACLRSGATVDGDVLRVEEARRLRQGHKTCWLEITLCEGKNRHIRRLCEAFGWQVLRLVRVAIGPLELGTLAKGVSRPLTQAELRILSELIAVRSVRR